MLTTSGSIDVFGSTNVAQDLRFDSGPHRVAESGDKAHGKPIDKQRLKRLEGTYTAGMAAQEAFLRF